MVTLHNLFLILFASLSALQLEASITSISGEVPGMSGRELYLLRTTDFLSNNWEKVESATIDEMTHSVSWLKLRKQAIICYVLVLGVPSYS